MNIATIVPGKIVFGLCLLLLTSAVSAQTLPAGGLGGASAVLSRVEPAQRQRIEAMLPRLDQAGRDRLAAALRTYDEKSTFMKYLGWAWNGGGVIVPFAGGIAGLLATGKIFGGMALAPLASMALWGAGLGAGVVGMGAVMYWNYHRNTRPAMNATLNGVLDELEAGAGTRTAAARSTAAGPGVPATTVASGQPSTGHRMSVLGQTGANM